MLQRGIYENIINQSKEEEIAATEQHELVCKRQNMDAAESPQILANYLADVIRKRLEETEQEQDRISFINKILQDAGMTDEQQIINSSSNLLTEVLSKEQALLQNQTNTETVRPVTGFRVSNLFTGKHSPIQLGEEIRREIATADEIYFIVSFLKVAGVRLLIDDLRKFCEKDRHHLRIITTTYTGATDAKAVKMLSELPNTEIRISYDINNEHLHAKSYIFKRNSGMHTAYVGSSNLSKTAQTDGLEWNVRVTNVENPHIIKAAIATFEQYWNEDNFEDFSLGGMEKLMVGLKQGKNRMNPIGFVYHRYSILPHQKQILDKLRVEREENNNFRNLVVAATGTGKTVISAFDYLDFKNNHPRARILFTAHREEILKKSLDTYRSVLNDANWGALMVGNYVPQDASDYEHLFISVGMLNSRFETIFEKLGPDYYDYIVIDEAHHSQANSYRKLFSLFHPEILLGLTATPERMDGKDLRPDFGGRISAEIRLSKALEAGLLTPFQYLCITDTVDLSSDSLWTGLKYNIERLSNKLCDIGRAQNIVTAIHKYLADEYTCRALCFCVNKKHADFMAKQLSLHGFSAASLTSDTNPALRVKLANNLREGRLHYLCVVDIFNEGVDIPELDTVLFLRPTESLTIFLQQLGRGLRLYPGKTELTVLDFVAQANKKYDFTSRFRALMTNPEKNVEKQIKEGFTFLPSGCSIIMEKKARQYILDNIHSAIYNKNRLIREINSYVNHLPTLSQFLENNGQDIRIIYQNNRCWTSLKRDANRITYENDSVTKRLEKGMGNLIHHNDIAFLHFVRDFIAGKIRAVDWESEKYSLMLYYDLFQDKLDKAGFNSVEEALQLIHQLKYHYFKEEMKQIVDYLLTNLQIKTMPLEYDLFPELCLYGCYTREEIFTLTGRQTANFRMQGSVTGVFDLKENNVSLLFITLNKSDKDFSPTTQYNDYLINEHLFHFQSQNTDTHQNRGGKRYTEHMRTGRKILMFVRQEKKDGFGNTCPFHCFGYVDFVSSYGDAPMDIQWKLRKPAMPQYLKVI